MNHNIHTRIRAWKRHSELSEAGPYDATILNRLKKLDDVELAATALNPEHHSDAKRIALKMLQQRGVEPDIAIPVVPSFVRPGNSDALRRQLLHGSNTLRRWAGILSLVLIGTVVLLVKTGHNYENQALSQARAQGLFGEAEMRAWKNSSTEPNTNNVWLRAIERIQADVEHQNQQLADLTKAARKSDRLFRQGEELRGEWLSKLETAPSERPENGLSEMAERNPVAHNPEVSTTETAPLETSSPSAVPKERLESALYETDAGQKLALAQSTSTVLVVASAVSLLTWIFLSAFRRHPARLLVLRRFNDKKLSRSTENLIVKQLRKFGHAVSLSDKFLRHTQRSDVLRFMGQSWLNPIVLAWIPIRLILRLFNRSKYGPIYVGDSRDYRNLAQRLRGRYTFNFEMACGTRESILIRSTDTWWKPVVAMAMASADVIIADLSDVADGTTWELERIDELNFCDKVVFIALRERLPDAKAALARYPKAFGSHIFAFDADGSVENDTAFIDSIVEAIARTCSPTIASVRDNEAGASV